MTRVSFILLADPPCSSSSWRPLADDKMWWSRRDSLVRITSLSLFIGHGVPSPVCANVVLVFHDGTDATSVVAMSGRLAQDTPIPTEHHLLSRWKEASLFAEKHPQKATLLGSAVATSVAVSHAPHIEAPSFSSASAGPASGAPSLDKRSLLRQLQSAAPLDFLRQHRLNGPEDLILKKTSRGAVEAAMQQWRGSGSGAHSAPTSDTLVQTFQVVLQRCLTSEPTAMSTTLLLLHEDYPEELPIYSAALADTGQGEHHIICLLGAVRDASDREVSACIAAAALLSTPLRVVGCNLGRTAEFTSKVCAGLCMHAVNADLGAAVARLREVDAGAGAGAGLLGKLPPRRAGGWTWDGKGNKAGTLSASSTAAVAAPAATAPLPASTTHLHTALWLPFTGAQLAVLCASSSTSASRMAAGASDRERVHDLVQAIVCALWRSRLASEGAAEGAAGAAAESSFDEVVPTVTLVLKGASTGCVRLVQLSQASVALQLAQAHQAAPAEWQVLQAVARVLAEASGEKEVDGGSGLVLRLARMTAGEGPVHVLDLVDVVPVCRAGSKEPFPAASGDSETAPPAPVQLWRRVYSSAPAEPAAGGPRSLLLLVRPDVDRHVGEEAVVPTRLVRCPFVSAAVAVCLLLQWSYSGVLLAAVDAAAAEFAGGGTDNVENEEAEEEDERRRRKRQRKEERRERKAKDKAEAL